MANPLPKQWPALILWILFTSSSWISDAAELAGIAKPEKSRLEVGTAGSGTTSLPLLVALDGGYFSRRGLSVSVNQLGATVAFGEIAIRMTARKNGMEVGKDIKLLYHRSPSEALSTFLMGNSDGVIITPPQTELAKHQGYPVIIDYYKEGLKIVGPGTSVTREFFQKYPNTIKAYLMAYLDGLKRAIDDEAYAKQIESKYTKISDPKILNENYQQGARVWNKDMTVDPVAIRVVLDDSSDPKAKSADPKRFYDNSLIEAVNREYASKLFPGDVR